ncbi:MAG TPA: hypothetical protein PLY68_04070 [Myxococcota bacterium]|nr:hypothetical protein [Myxococcota bacterium]HQP95354.1 hypothetical protein [Myxococcota bacterium]
MKENNDILIDGIEIPGIAETDPSQGDEMGIPLDSGDFAPTSGAAGSYGIDLDSGPMIRHDNSYDQAPATRPARKLPPLLRALATVYQRNASGMLNVSRDNETFLSMFMKEGRILNVSHADVSSGAVGSALLATGLITQRRLERAIKRSIAAKTPLDSWLAQSRTVSAVSIHHIVDSRCSEIVLDAMNTESVQVSFSRTLPEGLRKNCQIPLPWLLKEYKRRERDLPAIRARIPEPKAAFVRTASLASDPEPEVWEDLDLGAAEKQVYFFVDGTRDVEQLADATGQSRFSVMRAVASLISEGYLVATLEKAKHRKARHGLRVSSRALALTIGLAAFAGALVFGIGAGYRVDFSEVFHVRSLAWGDLFHQASVSRVQGAVLIDRMMSTEPTAAPDGLLAAHLILPSDIQAAVSMFKQAQEAAKQATETAAEPISEPAPEPVPDPAVPDGVAPDPTSQVRDGAGQPSPDQAAAPQPQAPAADSIPGVDAPPPGK